LTAGTADRTSQMEYSGPSPKWESGPMLDAVTQSGFAAVPPGAGTSPTFTDRTEETPSTALNQSQYVLKLVQDAAESYADSHRRVEVPGDGLPGGNLDVEA
jgi:hypothetical protein